MGASGPEWPATPDDAIARVRLHLLAGAPAGGAGPMVALQLPWDADLGGGDTSWVVVADAGVFWVVDDEVAGPLAPADAEALLAECSLLP